MMECSVMLGSGEHIRLPSPIRWEFCYGTGQPCDSFFVRCLWEGGQEHTLSEACRFFAHWEGQRVFTGVVDEFACLCGRDGLYLELSGRGMAALLLDNEAMPAQYQMATRDDIAANHVAPYGIEVKGGQSLPPVRDFTVTAGVSEWSVVEEFACYYGGIVPRFDREGNLVLDGHEDGTVLRLDGSVPITQWDYREERYGVLSQVAVRHRTSGEVQWVSDGDFLAQGGCARRVVSVPNTTGTAAMRYSADYQLRASRRERERLTVRLAGAFLAWPGQLVEVALGNFGANGRYRVARAEVACTPDGLFTTLVLGLPDSMI